MTSATRVLESFSRVECSGRKLKTLHTDNGGEYLSTNFGENLRFEGISQYTHSF